VRPRQTEYPEAHRTRFIGGQVLRDFAYGTLKPGERNYDRFCASAVTSAEPALTRGALYALPAGYPAVTPGDGWVHGYLLAFEDQAVLASLDALEAYDPSAAPGDNEYYRAEAEVFDSAQRTLGRAWIYLMTPDRVRRMSGVLVPQGSWSERVNKGRGTGTATGPQHTACPSGAM
jgi:gamma-glutamylcyclotransferase (GGCT)/AIG2-like uncharacterized protein YtfP